MKSALVGYEKDYIQFYLSNGSLIGLITAVVVISWGDLNKNLGLISTNPYICLKACCRVVSLPMVVMADGWWDASFSQKPVAFTAVISSLILGILKMVLTRIKIGNEIYTVTGKISGRLKDYRAATGTGDYKLEGKVEKEVFKANFSGYSNM